MPAFKIEPVQDWEWGYRAAVRLMWHHRWLLILLLLLALVCGLVVPSPLQGLMASELPFSMASWKFLNPKDLLQAIITSGMAVGLTALFLKSAGVETSWRTRAIAAAVVLTLEIGLNAFLLGMTELLEHVVHPGLKALVSLALFAFMIAYVNYTFCLCAQILVEGRPNFLRSYTGVARREWRLWQSFFLVFVLWLPVWALQSGVEVIARSNSYVQALLPYVENGLAAVVQTVLSMCAAALSTIWFLHPRVRTAEESTTWDVPTAAQPR